MTFPEGSLEHWAEETLGVGVARSEPLHGGANSCVKALLLQDGQQSIAKLYEPPRMGRLDSLEVESQALRFFACHDLAGVPRPLALDELRRWLLMTNVPGERRAADEVGEPDVQALLHFLKLLDDLGEKDGARQLPAASEATFSLRQLHGQLSHRLECLWESPDDDDVAGEMRDFLDNDLFMALQVFLSRAETQLRRAGLTADDELAAEHRRLSPSDFGFHNALRADDGTWSFVDFEYFGWDDPAKTLADLLLHPRMPLAPPLQRLLVRERLAVLPNDTNLLTRLRATLPVFGIQWCLILLNEFLPESRQRRQAAGVGDTDQRPTQLGKARALLQRLHDQDFAHALG